MQKRKKHSLTDRSQKSSLSDASSFEELFSQAEKHPDYWVESAILDFTDEVIRNLRTSGLSRGDMAEKLGCSLPQISRLLSGRNNFTLKTMVEVSQAVNCVLKLRLQPASDKRNWVFYTSVTNPIKIVGTATFEITEQKFAPCHDLPSIDAKQTSLNYTLSTQ